MYSDNVCIYIYIYMCVLYMSLFLYRIILAYVFDMYRLWDLTGLFNHIEQVAPGSNQVCGRGPQQEPLCTPKMFQATRQTAATYHIFTKIFRQKKAVAKLIRVKKLHTLLQGCGKFTTVRLEWEECTVLAWLNGPNHPRTTG